MTTIVQDDHLTAGAWAACATTTNLFINGCSLHGSHQVIILAARNSDSDSSMRCCSISSLYLDWDES